MLRPAEIEIVNRLVGSGLTRNASVLAVVMVTREHSRPEVELIDIVRNYVHLHERDSAMVAIQELKRLNWLVEYQSYGKILLRQAPSLRNEIASRLNDVDLADRLREMQAAFRPGVKVIGAITDELSYSSYLELLENAQKSVLLPMLVTSPSLASAVILKEKARAGVSVRVLLGSPAVVAALRGESNRQLAQDAVRGWSKHARDAGKNFEVRIATKKEDVILSASMLIDDSILRVDIYDHDKQRSLEGVLIQIEASPGTTPNLVHLFKLYFDHAWNRSRSPSSMGFVLWFARQSWRWLVFVLLSGLTLVAFRQDSFWAGIWGSAAATLLLDATAIWITNAREFIDRK